MTLIGGPLDGAMLVIDSRPPVIQCDCPCVALAYLEGSSDFHAELIGEPRLMRHAWLIEAPGADRYRYLGVVA